MSVEQTNPTVYGLEIEPLPDNEIPLAAIVLCKTLDDGTESLAIRYSEGFTYWERIGILAMALDTARTDAAQGWTEEDDDTPD